MAEIGLSIAAKLAEYLITPAVKRIFYCLRHREIRQDFERQRELLWAIHESVQNRVTQALNNTEAIETSVLIWLEQVKDVMQQIDHMEQESKFRQGSCRCPILKKYGVSKKLSKKIYKMIYLRNHSKFEVFTRTTALPDIECFSSGNFKYFGSTKLAFKKLLKAIQDDNKFLVGLYGMGGSGKTTLVKEVGRKAKELELFDRVVFTSVSQTVNVRRIQGEISDLLSLTLREETEAGIARRISKRLQGREKILVILDDVWGKLNLEEIGIPALNDENYRGCNCKVLLTTRVRQVCCSMDCQKIIPLNLLSEEESWILFQHHARIVDKPSWLSEDVAREIVGQCKGLPIAIEAVATALKGKSSNDEWKVALHQLKNSKPMHTEEGVRDAFTCLKFSYDYINDSLAKSIFLMCSLFPEDHDISREDLFRYGMGLGLANEAKQFEIARSQVNVGINCLIESCLLTHSDKGKDHLKMHDVVRDVAIWITSQERGKIMENPDEKALKECFAISSWYRKGNYHLPHEFDAPKLEVLLLNTRNPLDLSYVSFQWLEALRVLAIINESHYNKSPVSLPQSTDSSPLLPNLQTLRLVGLVLDDVSFIASLKSLKILDLRASRFKELPSEITEFKKLRLLDLSWCELDEGCYKVLGKCKQLQEMYVLKDPRCN